MWEASMSTKTFFEIFGFMIGILFSVIITMVAVYLIYARTTASYEAGRAIGESVLAERPSRKADVYIKDGMSLREVADHLEEEEIIPNALVFWVEGTLLKQKDPFEGGLFTLDTGMDNAEILATLRKSNWVSEDIVVTIPEGVTRYNIAEILERDGVISAEEFIEACDNGVFFYSFLRDVPDDRENRLEGYLFPDTYFFAPDSSAETIIHKMLTRFEEVYSVEYRLRARELGLTADEVITMASIIEKEIKVSEERARAASVMYNRLEAEMRLEMCSTIIYALNKAKDRLLDSDLLVDSPYNTYLHPGLPLGPISNPGAACINAALYPEETSYLFFVLMDEETGEHFFTDDYDAFVDAKIEYNQRF